MCDLVTTVLVTEGYLATNVVSMVMSLPWYVGVGIPRRAGGRSPELKQSL